MSDEALLLEGRAALDRGAWEAARAAFETALSRDESPEVLEGLGWALHWLDRTDDALAARERAFRLYREGGRPRDAARVAYGLAVDAIELVGEAPATGWLERARHLLEGLEPGIEHGWLALWEGHFALLLRRDPKAARAHGDRAGELARRLGAFDLEMLGVALEGLVMVAEGDVQEGMRRLDGATAAALTGEIKDLDAVGATCCLLVHACERVRDYQRAAEWAERVESFARQWGITPALTVCRTQYAAMLIGRGAWQEAEGELLRATQRLTHSRPLLSVEGLEQLAELRRRQGRWEEAEELYARAEGRSLALLGRAAIACEGGDAATACDLLERFERRTPPDNWNGRATGLALLVCVRLTLQRPDAARQAFDALVALDERAGVETIHGARLLAEAALRRAEGDHEGARPVLEDAVDVLLRAHAPWEAARARLELARCLLALGRRDPATREASAAAATLRELGAARDVAAAEALLAGEGAADESPKASGAAAALTPRELEVLRLVARGLADKQIADALHVSGHTVHRHVSNIRTKLGLPSRAAAVAWAAQHGLL